MKYGPLKVQRHVFDYHTVFRWQIQNEFRHHTEKILNDSIDAAGTYGACVCGLPAVDTMLYSEDGKVVTTIPERSKLFNGQAPDSFSLPRFLEMQANLTEEQREVITGTSQICTMNNQPIYIIEGDPLNFKLTTDGDLLIFKSIIDDQTV